MIGKVLTGLVFLQDAASRSSQLTNGMVNILTSFDERLARLEKTILPVYNETKNLQQKQESKLVMIYFSYF
jgi:exocyst complex protein 7